MTKRTMLRTLTLSALGGLVVPFAGCSVEAVDVGSDELGQLTQPTVCGVSDLQHVESYVPEVVDGVEIPKSFIDEHAPMVAHVTTVGAGGCSGTLLGDGLLLTNAHCVDPGIEDWWVTFNYQLDPDGNQHPFEVYQIEEIVEENSQIDFAILRIAHSPENRWGAASIESRRPVLNERAALIGHPTLSDDTNFKTTDVGSIGRVFDNHNMYFRSIDTYGGASGSGIVSFDTGRLLGVNRAHGAHFCQNELANTGTQMFSIVEQSSVLDADHGSGRLFSTSGGALGDQLWSASNWRSSWRHMIRGKFGGNSFDDLFFYDGTLGQAQFYTVNSSGAIARLGAQFGGMRKNWTQIVPIDVNVDGTDELIFYDAATRYAGMYRTNGSGSLTRFLEFSWSSNWRFIRAGNFTSRAGNELLYYDYTTGDVYIYGVNSDGRTAKLRQNTGISTEIDAIVVGEFGSGSGPDDLALYDSETGLLKFYSVAASGALLEVASVQIGTGFTQFVAGDFGGGAVLAAYHRAGARTDFFAVQAGAVSLVDITFDQRNTYGKLIGGNFTSSAGSEIFYYDRYRE